MSTPLPRFSIFRRLLCLSLAVGGVVDLLVAALLLAAPEALAALLGLPLPEVVYQHALAIVLAMLAACYLLASYDPVRYIGNVGVAIAGRSAAGLAFALAAWRDGLAGLYLLAGIELAFAAAHFGFWWPTRR